MAKTDDGFQVAEADLQIRGPGEFLGQRQSGLPGFRVANLIRDAEILQHARDIAFRIVNEDRMLSQPQNHPLKDFLTRSRQFDLAGVG